MSEVTERARVLMGVAMGRMFPAAAKPAAAKEAWKVLSKTGELFSSVSTPDGVFEPVAQRTNISHMPALDFIIPPGPSVRVTFEDGAFVMHRIEGQSMKEVRRVEFAFDIRGHFVSHIDDEEIAPKPGELMPKKPVELVLLEEILRAGPSPHPGQFIASF